MLWLISGPSSVGKSTFTQSDFFIKIFEYSGQTDNVLMNSAVLDPRFTFNPNRLIHYNVCHSMVFGQQRRVRRTVFGRKRDVRGDHAKDAFLGQVVKSRHEKKVIVLVCSKQQLLARVKSRKQNETGIKNYVPEKRGASIFLDEGRYNQSLWLELYRRIDFLKLYENWICFLEKRGMEYVLIDSTTPDYKTIHTKSGISKLL